MEPEYLMAIISLRTPVPAVHLIAFSKKPIFKGPQYLMATLFLKDPSTCSPLDVTKRGSQKRTEKFQLTPISPKLSQDSETRGAVQKKRFNEPKRTQLNHLPAASETPRNNNNDDDYKEENALARCYASALSP